MLPNRRYHNQKEAQLAAMYGGISALLYAPRQGEAAPFVKILEDAARFLRIYLSNTTYPDALIHECYNRIVRAEGHIAYFEGKFTPQQQYTVDRSIRSLKEILFSRAYEYIEKNIGYDWSDMGFERLGPTTTPGTFDYH